MAASDFTTAQRAEIDRAIRAAEQECRFEFSVYVGPSHGDARGTAERLHASLVAPARSILILVDPVARALEIVTGADVRRTLSDDEAGLAALAMQGELAEHDLVGGLVRGIDLLAEHARVPRMRHTDEPD